MDGLPPVPQPQFDSHSQGGAPPAPGAVPQAPSHSAPVGRPSADPDRQSERAETSAAVSRLMKTLPRQATDYKIAIFRLRGRTGRHAEPRPCTTILISDLEEAAESGYDSDSYIQETLDEKVGSGRYLCVPQDAHGTKVKKAASWEVTVGEEDDEMRDGWGDEEDTEVFPGGVPGMQGGFPFPGAQQAPNNPYGPPNNPYGSPPPPPPGGGDTPPGMLSEVRAILDSQRSTEGGGMSSMIAMMMQQQQSQSEQQRLHEERMREERERRESERRDEERRWREEERQREERREQREQQARNERLQLLATLAPAVMPLLQKMMDKPKDEITPILLTKLVDGDKGRDHLHEIMQVMGESTRQQLLSSSEMSRQQMQQMGEMNKMSMQHVLKLAQDTMAAEREIQSSEDDDPMGKFTKVVKMIGPMLAGMQGGGGQPQQGYQSQPAQQQQPARQQVAHAPSQQERAGESLQREGKQPPPPLPDRNTNPDVTDEQWIHASLDTVRRLETGEIPAVERPTALAWCAQNLPRPMLEAIAKDDQDTIMELAGPVVFSDANLQEWLSEELHQRFLQGAIADIKKLLVHGASEQLVQQMASEQEQYHEFKAQAQGSETEEGDPSDEAESVDDAEEGPTDEDDSSGILSQDDSDHYQQAVPEGFYGSEEGDEASEVADAEPVKRSPKTPPPAADAEDS